MITELRSDTVSVGIGEGFVVVGERINPTRRKKLIEALETGDMHLVKEDAKQQVRAGAQVLDVNVGLAGIDEVATMEKAVRAVMSATDVPLCIDSSNVDAIEAGLKAFGGKALINSVSAEKEKLELVLPLAKKYGSAVIGLAYGGGGISDVPAERLEAAERIVEAARSAGIPASDVMIDCLALTLGTNHLSATICLETMRLVKERLGSNLILGVSNISFGLPNRPELNSAFLALAIGAGLGSGIINPLDRSIMKTIYATELALGRDEYGMKWIEVYRQTREM